MVDVAASAAVGVPDAGEMGPADAEDCGVDGGDAEGLSAVHPAKTVAVRTAPKTIIAYLIDPPCMPALTDSSVVRGPITGRVTGHSECCRLPGAVKKRLR